MKPWDEIWKYLRAAPLPVVISLVMVLAGAGAVRVETINREAKTRSDENKQVAVAAQDKAEEAATTAEQAQKSADKTQAALEKVADKMQELLVAIGELRGELKASRRRAATP